MSKPDYKAICEAAWAELKPLGHRRGPYIELLPVTIRNLVEINEAQREALDEIKRVMAE